MPTASYKRWLNIQQYGYDSETEMKRMSLNDWEIYWEMVNKRASTSLELFKQIIWCNFEIREIFLIIWTLFLSSLLSRPRKEERYKWQIACSCLRAILFYASVNSMVLRSIKCCQQITKSHNATVIDHWSWISCDVTVTLFVTVTLSRHRLLKLINKCYWCPSVICSPSLKQISAESENWIFCILPLG